MLATGFPKSKTSNIISVVKEFWVYLNIIEDENEENRKTELLAKVINPSLFNTQPQSEDIMNRLVDFSPFDEKMENLKNGVYPTKINTDVIKLHEELQNQSLDEID